jgi:hypothetical protein
MKPFPQFSRLPAAVEHRLRRSPLRRSRADALGRGDTLGSGNPMQAVGNSYFAPPRACRQIASVRRIVGEAKRGAKYRLVGAIPIG